MAKPTDLEGRFAQAMKKGEKQDRAYRTFIKKGNYDTKKGFEQSRKHEDHTKSGNPIPLKRTTSDGYMPRKESVIERSNRQVAERNKGKTKEQISNDAFKSGRTSGRY